MTIVRTTRRVALWLTAVVAPTVGTNAVRAADDEKPVLRSAVDAVAELRAAWGRIDELRARLDALAAEFRAPRTAEERRVAIRDEGTTIQAALETAWDVVVRAYPPAWAAAPADPFVRARAPQLLPVLVQYHRFADALVVANALAPSTGDDASGSSADRALALQVGGVAHFAEHRFLKAAHAFLAARELGAGRLDPRYAPFEQATAECLRSWPLELERREKEAAAGDLPQVTLRTPRGEIVVELFENEAPNTVANFIALVERGFYRGLAFHRVIPLFMVQGGDPETREGIDAGAAAPAGLGYRIACECEREDARRHYSGSLSMAHAGKDTGGSQFFITQVPTPHLDGKHTVFGRVMSGIDVVRCLRAGDRIVDARVMRKRDHEYVPIELPIAPPLEGGQPKSASKRSGEAE